MMDAKKQALRDMMSELKGSKAEKLKVMVAGNSPEAVKQGLEKAEDVVEEVPKTLGSMKPEMGMKKPEMMTDPKLQGLMMALSPEEKQSLLKALMSEVGGEKEDEGEGEGCETESMMD